MTKTATNLFGKRSVHSLMLTGLGGVHLIAGSLLGLLLLELLLRFNSPLLAGLRGLGAPMPVDSPLTTRTYDVRYSDADEIFWRPDLIRSIPSGENRLEAHVVFTTDELGFRNAPPLPETADFVVLGRSYSLGAQNNAPWPNQLAESTGRSVVNFSEPGSSLDVKQNYLIRFGLPLHPRWVIVEVIPAVDTINYQPNLPLMLQLLPIPLAQQFLLQLFPRSTQSSDFPIYPLTVDLPGRTLPLTCCVHYLETLTINQSTLEQSRGWRSFTQGLVNLNTDIQAGSACMAILYLPMKPEIYFPLALHPDQLTPALRGVIPLRLDGLMDLVPDPSLHTDILSIRANIPAGRNALASFAAEHHLLFIDPTSRMMEAVAEGEDPFMTYDSHLSTRGHALVAQTVGDALQTGGCS